VHNFASEGSLPMDTAFRLEKVFSQTQDKKIHPARNYAYRECHKIEAGSWWLALLRNKRLAGDVGGDRVIA